MKNHPITRRSFVAGSTASLAAATPPFAPPNVPGNFFVVCGDRHWQYHSVHPKTGLHEFSVGAASDQHAGGSPGSCRSRSSQRRSAARSSSSCVT